MKNIIKMYNYIKKFFEIKGEKPYGRIRKNLQKKLTCSTPRPQPPPPPYTSPTLPAPRTTPDLPRTPPRPPPRSSPPPPHPPNAP